MARPLRVEFPGAIYHVTSHMLGTWKKESTLLFEDDRDRIRFLDRLGERVQEFDIRLYLFTLMANHFHPGWLPECLSGMQGFTREKLPKY